ncbi:MAG TPA: 2-phospho-L-lactate guanylyltransferase [candidate division Zixibacteria bacterium]|nr:2-phospho-L-lactate guanylyltransferase [candidate division Zixibacteria bacterium]
MSSDLRAIVPHRGLAASKSRLAGVLGDAERMDLARRLLARVLAVVRDAVPDVVVISPDADLEPIVTEAGARLEVQRGLGLNAGLEQARANAVREGVKALVVLHGDLPYLAVDDVRALADAVAARGVAVAPDRAGTGTNGLAERPLDSIPFRFGRGSFARHLAEAESRGLALTVVRRPGLAFDLDTPDDLAEWLRVGDVA